ncbi:MAG: anion permease [Planctomycetota bacterium]
MGILLLTLAVLFLAFSNGANDNFKGVATLYGSRRLSFKVALGWATLTTLLGSALAILLGSHLFQTFSGKGLVSDEVVSSLPFVLAVGIGAAATVFVATLAGLPISTTHALVGGLVGSGLVFAGVDLGRLGSTFLLPLLSSPLIAFLLTLTAYRILRAARLWLGLREESCLCIRDGEASPLLSRMFASSPTRVVVHREGCSVKLQGRIAGIDAERLLDTLHFLSAGAVCTARGLNDTPKIVALLAVGAAAGSEQTVLWIGLAMALGGLVSARRVAETLGRRITAMNNGQGFAANLVTAGLVTLASSLGLGVSTTHVSVGALFGIGAATGTGQRRAITRILLAWVVTLPLAAAIAALSGVLLLRM